MSTTKHTWFENKGRVSASKNIKQPSPQRLGGFEGCYHVACRSRQQILKHMHSYHSQESKDNFERNKILGHENSHTNCLFRAKMATWSHTFCQSSTRVHKELFLQPNKSSQTNCLFHVKTATWTHTQLYPCEETDAGSSSWLASPAQLSSPTHCRCHSYFLTWKQVEPPGGSHPLSPRCTAV